MIPNDPVARALLDALPGDGSSAGNARLRYALAAKLGRAVSEDEYAEAREALVAQRLAIKGRGRGGSLRRAQATATPPALGGEPPSELVLSSQEDASAPPKRASYPRRASSGTRDAKSSGAPKLIAYRHDQKRSNNPEVGMVTPDTDPDAGTNRWAYDPHLDPALQFDVRPRAGSSGLSTTPWPVATKP